MKSIEFNENDLKGIDKVGPVTEEALMDAGILDKWYFIQASSAELADITGLPIMEASRIQMEVRQQMQVLKLLDSTEIRADELLKRRQGLERLTTGCKEFDSLLGGGYETEALYELYAQFGSGKTQACFTACVMAQAPKDKGGLEGRVLYIDTENTFRPERVLQIAKARGFAKTEKEEMNILHNIIVEQARSSGHQSNIINNASGLVRAEKIKLIVVDSGTGKYRAEYVGQALLARRQQALNVMMEKLHRLAENHKIVILFTNQVSTSPGGFSGDIAVGGNIVSHQSTYRLHLQKAKKVGTTQTYKITMVDSPMHDKDESIFILGEKGLEDLKK